MEGHDCLRTCLSLCQPVQLPPPWDFLRAQGNPRRGPANPDEAPAALLKRHAVEALSSCGLVRPGADGTTALNPALRTAGVELIAVTDAENEQLVDIVTANGCLPSDERPLFAMRDDGFNRSIPQEDGLYLLTATLGDAVVLRSLGLPAAPILGLEDLRGEEFGRLAERLTLTVEEETRECFNGSANSKPRLTIVSGSPLEMNLAEPQAAREAIRFLAQLEKFRRLDLDAVGVWRPSADKFEAIQFAIGRREAGCVFEAMRDGTENALSLEALHDSHSKRSASLIDPTGAILGVAVPGPLGEPSQAERAEARQRYERALAGQLLGRLVAEADAADNPIKKASRLELAQLVDLWNVKMLRAREQARHAVLGSGDRSERRKDNSIQELLALGKEITMIEAANFRSTGEAQGHGDQSS
jgi:hypothetical protein